MDAPELNMQVQVPLGDVANTSGINSLSNNMSSRNKLHYKTICEEVEDEEDIVAICGVRWCEKDDPVTLIEEINNSHVPSHESDETDAKSEGDSEDSEEVTVGSQRDFRFELRKPPTVPEAQKAFEDLQALLKPAHSNKGRDAEKFSPAL